jgi:hypothetical protein
MSLGRRGNGWGVGSSKQRLLGEGLCTCQAPGGSLTLLLPLSARVTHPAHFVPGRGESSTGHHADPFPTLVTKCILTPQPGQLPFAHFRRGTKICHPKS